MEKNQQHGEEIVSLEEQPSEEEKLTIDESRAPCDENIPSSCSEDQSSCHRKCKSTCLHSLSEWQHTSGHKKMLPAKK